MIAVANTVQMLFTAINILIFVRILLTWAPMAGIQIDPYNPVVSFIIRAADLFLEPFRRVIPPIGGLDLSPIIAIFVLNIVGDIVVQSLYKAAF